MTQSNLDLPWQFAEAWQSVAAVQPDTPAVVQGERVVTWREFDEQANGLAQWLLDVGLGRHASLAVYLYNCPEYLIACNAAFKVSATPFNVNYRYGEEELLYLFNNADCEVAVFGTEFSDLIDRIRGQLPNVRWVAVPSAEHPTPEWASDWNEVIATSHTRAVSPPWGRTGEDLLMLYTGGTTGLPKGVLWQHTDLWGAMGYGANPLVGLEALPSAGSAGDRAEAGGRPVTLIACPLMHGTGLIGAFIGLNIGGTVALLPSKTFDSTEFLNEVQRLGAARITVAGMAFCTPILEALEKSPGNWNLSSVEVITSSGAMWSQENKTGLLRHMAGAVLADVLGSSEAVGLGMSIAANGSSSETATFYIGEKTAVFTEAGHRVEPGSGESGLLAIGGFLPLGYYKDEAKTAATFRVYEGRRWSVPGDWATVNADGTLILLGRGSQCINTGGEKVYPEEVEESLKRYPAVRDAAIVGLPDARFGETVCALVELRPNHQSPTKEALANHVRAQLAAYKIPRAIFFVESVNRAANGKLDYKNLKAIATGLGESNNV